MLTQADGGAESKDTQADMDAMAHQLLDISTSNIDSVATDSASGEKVDIDGKTYTVCTRTIVKGKSLLLLYIHCSDWLAHRFILSADIIPKFQLEVLPEGWKELIHETGLPLYCHMATRVVTWSRPYFLANRYAKEIGRASCRERV